MRLSKDLLKTIAPWAIQLSELSSMLVFRSVNNCTKSTRKMLVSISSWVHRLRRFPLLINLKRNTPKLKRWKIEYPRVVERWQEFDSPIASQSKIQISHETSPMNESKCWAKWFMKTHYRVKWTSRKIPTHTRNLRAHSIQKRGFKANKKTFLTLTIELKTKLMTLMMNLFKLLNQMV